MAHWTAARALEEMRWTIPDADSAYYLYVADESGVLQGVVGLRDLVVAAPETTLEAMMYPHVVAVQVTDDQEYCVRMRIQIFNLIILPYGQM